MFSGIVPSSRVRLGLALLPSLLCGCTNLSFWPDRWVSENGASLYQMGNGRYEYTPAIGSPSVTCTADGENIYACDDGTVSRLEPIDGPSRQVMFDGRVFILGPI